MRASKKEKSVSGKGVWKPGVRGKTARKIDPPEVQTFKES